MKKMLIVIIALLALTGCATRIISQKQIGLQSNERNAKDYRISYQFTNPADAKEISITATQNNSPINSVKISRDLSTINLSIQTNHAKFRLMNDYIIKGWVILKPINYQDQIIEIPFSVKINSWLNTNYWLMLSLFSMLFILAFINFVILYIFKVAATGTVDLLYPGREPYLIYPRSKWFHLHRNRCIIGSGEKDDVYIKDKQGLKPSHIVMIYFKKPLKKGIAAEVKAIGFYNKSYSEVKQLQSKDLRFGYSIPDYLVSSDEDSSILCEREYFESYKSTLDASEDRVYANKDIALKISLN